MVDPSNGYEAFSSWWTEQRTHTIRPDVVLAWARDLPARTAVLDLGCGDGFPMSVALADAGFDAHGVDASPGMIRAFRQRLPDRQAECCPVQESVFFHRTFDGVIAWGLVFLLAPEVQQALIARVAQAMNPGGRFLFTAPWQPLEWRDALTGHASVSLGRHEYVRVLQTNGLIVVGDAVDEGENYYFLTQKE